MTIEQAIENREKCLAYLIGCGPKATPENVEAVRLSIEALKEKAERRWIPVTERLPDNNHPVLVRCANTTISGGYVTHIGSCDMKQFWFLRTQPGIASFPVQEWKVTHWMPLPEPPEY